MYVAKTEVNFYDVFNATVLFEPGLNIISGENGTFKTKVLKQIKSGQGKSKNGQNVPVQRVLAFSPKRNSVRQDLQSVLNDFRRNNKNYDTITAERIQAKLDDSTFSNYAGLSELFFAYYDKKCRDGGNQIEHMNEVSREFNMVIGSVFPDYEIKSDWNKQVGLPNVYLKKHAIDVPLNALSSGEQEVFSLMLNLYVSAPKVDIILIDEPEIHLNWHLEERLFQYFSAFCEEQRKQLIISTHSRVIFKDAFLKKAQFFMWDAGKIVVRKDAPSEQRKRIAGEAIDIIRLEEFSTKTIFVEDKAHEETISAIATELGAIVKIVALGNSSNVKSMFRLTLTEGGWQNAIFLVDGDNEGNAFPKYDNYIHLDRYCIENYWIEINVLATLYKKSGAEIKQLVLNAIQRNRENILNKNKYFEFIFNRLKVEDIKQELLVTLDASEITGPLLDSLGETLDAFLKKYVALLEKENKLQQIFPVKLVDWIRGNV